MLLCEAFSDGRQSHLRLHAGHGRSIDNLNAIELTTICEERSPLQAFIAECWGQGLAPPDDAQKVEDPNLGVACYVESSKIYVGHREGCTRSIASILLAEVSCTLLETGLTLIAIILPGDGDGLQTIGMPRKIVRGWFMLFRGPEPCLAILDAFSQVGCLRHDFGTAFPIPPTESHAIGQGACALVYKIRNWNGTSLAVKKMNSSVGCASIAREMSTLTEVQKHENVVRVHGFFYERDAESIRFSIAFERASAGDLLTKVCKDGALSEDEARPLFIGILRGLAHIHARQIAHRDIKTENILLDGRRRHTIARIADFGLATWLSDEVQMSQRCGSPGYVAPEVCLGRQYGSKVDIFGVGVMLYFVLSKDMPFFRKRCHVHIKKDGSVPAPLE
mmetsp:Transcript_117482/g.184760  ORF Transcript_117482/g.184760 Transcript_117482/m.184760 type:complete len:391 (-) Transcript_117482:390-1562(-)